MKKYLFISVGMLVLFLTIYGYSQRIDFFANSLCPSGDLYVERVIGGWKQTPSANPLGLCIPQDDIKNDLVKDPTLKDKLISFFRYTIFNQQANAAGNTYYVATDGDDSRSCGEAQNINTPRQTIKAGEQCLSPGDTLLVRGGTYKIPPGTPTQDYCFICTLPSGTSWENATTVKGYPGERPIISGPNTQPHTPGYAGGITFYSNGYKSYVIVENFIVEWVGVGIDTQEGHHIRVKDIEVRNTQGGGVVGHADYAEYINLDIHDWGLQKDFSCGTCDHGYYYGGDNTLIEGGQQHDGYGYGIQLRAPGASSNNAVIRSTRTYNNTLACGMVQVTGGGHLVYNNVIYGNGCGILLYGASQKIYNNTIVNNDGGGVVINSGNSSSVEIKNNIIYQNGSRAIADETGGTPIQSNNLTTDPLFVNASINDFHLRTGSPAIDAGLTLPEVPCDYDGNGRPAGSAYDIGAYEYGGTPSSDCTKGVVASASPSPSPEPFPSHPCELPVGGYKGFGRNTIGGNTSPIYRVTTLSGGEEPGTLRDAVSEGNRCVVFDVAGSINIDLVDLEPAGPNITIDGFTAPSPGITITHAQLRIAHPNSIVRGMRFHNEVKCNGFRYSTGIKNIVFDHITARFGGDESMSTTDCSDMTVSWSVIARPNPEHNTNYLVHHDVHGLSIHHNLFFDAKRRNPWVGTKPEDTREPISNIDVRNNLMWDVSGSSSNHGTVFFGEASGNIINNYYKTYAGCDSDCQKRAIVVCRSANDASFPENDPFCKGQVAAGRVYVAGNRSQDGQTEHINKKGTGIEIWPVPDVPTTDACTAAWDVKAQAGGRGPNFGLDATDQGFMNKVTPDCQKPSPSPSPSPSPTPGPSIFLSANPSSVPAPGYTVLIRWQVQNASSCNASGGWSGSKNPQQGREYHYPSQTTTYTLTCQGPGGSSQKSVTVTVGQAGGACHLLDSSKPVPPGWGAAYNPISPQKELLISVSCDTQTATFNLGNNQQTTYIYHQGYLKPGGSANWMPITFSGSNIQANAWYPAKATYFKAFNPDQLSQTGQVAAYMCHWTGYPEQGGGGWKCGCRDSSCATPYWQLQEFRQ